MLIMEGTMGKAKLWMAALLACAAGSVLAQSYPQRPIRMVVPVSVGAGADLIARLLGPKMAERMGQPVVVENLPAGGGHIAISATTRAAPDGYTVLMAPTSYALQPVLNKNVAYDPEKSYTPIGLVAVGSMVLAVSDSASAKSLKDFVAAAKAKPGSLSYGSPGNGTPQHLAMELLKLDGNLDLLHVPYKEAAGASKDLVGGQIQAAILTASSAAPLVKTGRVHVIGNLGEAKSALFADAPLLKDEGFPSLGVGVWVGMVAPAGTPAEIVQKLNAEMNAILAAPENREAVSKMGLVPVGGPPERLTSLIRSDVERWGRAVKAAKIKVD
jgi:tripartite-type tricarboxylate transporter receptor subunit TctC